MGPTSHANTQVIQKVSLKVPNEPSVPKWAYGETGWA